MGGVSLQSKINPATFRSCGVILARKSLEKDGEEPSGPVPESARESEASG